ncbi:MULTISPECIES: hypothetical protein [Nitrospirillum]|uniref:Uncharacterized protein n=1 Tax=Nitrospirillum amazonense TaxID=28077 RepID=A0A560G1Q4_9PROT|nr:hypothetical protein [Nitrospirillum amazonense]MEC4589546.1 hypothetical protein [Nitrospirillum amazonense]TWB27640.1 hypothetical protein FBZ88_106100 [Nitrospirillum amazonense]
MASNGQSIWGEVVDLYREVFAAPGRIARFLGMPAVFSLAAALFFQFRSIQYLGHEPDQEQWGEFGFIFLVLVVFQTWAHMRSLSAWGRWVRTGQEPVTFLQPGFGRNEWAATGWQILYFFMLLIALMVLMFARALVTDSSVEDQAGPGVWLAVLAGAIAVGILALHVTVRLGIGLMAILAGEAPAFSRYWSASSVLGWRLTGVVLISQAALQLPCFLINRLLMGDWLTASTTSPPDVVVSLLWTLAMAVVNFICVALLGVALARAHRALSQDGTAAQVLPAAGGQGR